MTVEAKQANEFQKALKDDEQGLSVFLQKLAEFDARFCEMMYKGSEFTVRIDVRGNKGKLNYARVYVDDTTNVQQKGGKKK